MSSSSELYNKLTSSMSAMFRKNPNATLKDDMWVISLYSTDDHRTRLCNIDPNKTPFEIRVLITHDLLAPISLTINPNLASFPLFNDGKLRISPDLVKTDLGAFVKEIVELTEMYVTIRLRETVYRNSIYERFDVLVAAMTPSECDQLVSRNSVGVYLKANLKGFEQECENTFKQSNDARRKTAEFIAKKNLELMSDIVKQQKALAEAKAKYAQYKRIITEEENFDPNSFDSERAQGSGTSTDGVQLQKVINFLKRYRDDMSSLTQKFGESVINGDVTEAAMREYLQQREKYYEAKFIADASEKIN